MDQSFNEELQTVSGASSRSQYLKKAFKVLLSVSIFSFLLSYPSWLPLFLHSFNLYISAYPFNFSNYSIDRSYMFLLFNGILAFLARNSGLISSSPYGIDLQEKSPERSAQHGFSEVNYSIENAVVEEESKEGSVLLITEGGEEEEEEEEENYDDEEEKEQEQQIESLIKDEEEEEYGNWSLSTEELNKKCEDFIKRMKEEIMYESRRSIMV